jgi:hypothetical protein
VISYPCRHRVGQCWVIARHEHVSINPIFNFL